MTIKELVEELKWNGYDIGDISGMSDEEIIGRINSIGISIKSIEIAKEAMEAL